MRIRLIRSLNSVSSRLLLSDSRVLPILSLILLLLLAAPATAQRMNWCAIDFSGWTQGGDMDAIESNTYDRINDQAGIYMYSRHMNQFVDENVQSDMELIVRTQSAYVNFYTHMSTYLESYKLNEEGFYHSTDPACASAFWDGTKVILHWYPDYRSALALEYGQDLSMVSPEGKQFSYYEVRKSTNGPTGPFAEIPYVTNTTTFEDTEVPYEQLSNTYYKIISLESGEPGAAEYDYSNPVPVDYAGGPYFWLIDKALSEFQYGPEEINSATLVFRFGYHGDYAAYTPELHYQGSGWDSEQTQETYTQPEPQTIEFQISGITLGEMKADGGYSFRLVLSNGVAPVMSYPDEGALWTSVNNRMMTADYYTYYVNLTSDSGCYDTWKSTLMNDVASAVLYGSVELADGVFIDCVSQKYLYTKQQPFELSGLTNYAIIQLYRPRMVELIRYVCSEFPTYKFYVNNMEKDMLGRIEKPVQEPEELLAGCMKDGITADHYFNCVLKNSLWVANSDSMPSANLILRSIADPDGLGPDEGSRECNWKINLAAYLLAQKTPEVHPLGRTYMAHKKYPFDDPAIRRIPYYPELMIEFGAPTDPHVFDGFNWDDLIYTWGNEDISALPSAFEFTRGVENYVFRRFEHALVIANASANDDHSYAPGNHFDLDELPQDIKATLPFVMHELFLGVGGGAKTLQLAERFYTVPISMIDQSTGDRPDLDMYEPNAIRIFMDNPISSPWATNDLAAGPLFADPAVQSVLTVEPRTWDDGPIETVIANADAVKSGGGSLELKDDGVGGDETAGDGIWSSSGFVCSVPQGDYELPVYIRALEQMGHNDHYEVYDTMTVHVVRELSTDFQNKSSFTGQLATASLLPYGSVTLDYDQDGKLDLFVSNRSGTEGSMLFQSHIVSGGVPEFQNRTTEAFLPDQYPPSSARGVSVADYDQSINAQDLSWPDLFIAHSDEGHVYWNDEGYFRVDAEAEPWMFNSWVGVWGDYDGNGWLDLYLGRDNAMSYDPDPEDASKGMEVDRLLRNIDGHLFPDVQQIGFGGTHSTGTFAAAWGFANSDKMPDLFVGDYYISGGRSSILFINAGESGGTFQLVDETDEWFADMQPPENTTAVAWFDYDQDGDQDLITGSHLFRPTLRLFQNQSKQQASEFIEVDLKSLGCWQTDIPVNAIAIIDYDNNGFQDILVMPKMEDDPVLLYACKPIGGQLRYVDMGRSCNITWGSGEGATVADFDQDGREDIYLGRPSSDGEFYFKNVSNLSQDTNHWIAVDLNGGGGNNYDGIGAEAKIIVGELNALQVKSAGHGRGLQQSRALHFGLGEYAGSHVDVTVTWPDSNVQVVSCPIDTMTVIEDDTEPMIIAETVTSAYQPGPGGTDWIFTWRTENMTDIRLDHVNLISSYSPGDNCFCGGSQTLSWGDQHVDVTITPIVDGTYEHRLVWEEGCCYPGCSYQYRVYSATRYKTDTSAIKSFARMRICTSQ